jgi:hypothetical protein
MERMSGDPWSRMLARRSSLNSDAPWPGLAEANARVLDHQRKLHRWSKDEPARRFDDVFKSRDQPRRRSRARGCRAADDRARGASHPLSRTLLSCGWVNVVGHLETLVVDGVVHAGDGDAQLALGDLDPVRSDSVLRGLCSGVAGHRHEPPWRSSGAPVKEGGRVRNRDPGGSATHSNGNGEGLDGGGGHSSHRRCGDGPLGG